MVFKSTRTNPKYSRLNFPEIQSDKLSTPMAASSSSGTNAITEGMTPKFFISSSFSVGSKQYPYPSHVNPASFVSIKLVGRFNYHPWQEQMMCLVESYDMLCFIDGKTLKNPHENKNIEYSSDVMFREWKRSDNLVKGWIFGSLTETAMRSVVGSQTAYEVWDKLKTTYTVPPPSPAPITKEIDELGKYVPLCRAIQTGDGVETEIFLNKNPDALTCKLNNFEETTLHVAVGNPDNIYILEILLERIHDPKLLLTMVDGDQGNALHYAARLDNTEAAKILVKKNPCLLFIVDSKKRLPIETAIFNSHEKTFLYLFEVCKQHKDLISQKDALHNPFDDEHGALLLDETIFSGILDVAYELLNNYPTLATTMVDDKAPLYCIAKKLDAFRSAKRYNFYQRFVYSRVPEGNFNLDNKRSEQDIENQETYTDKPQDQYSQDQHIETRELRSMKNTVRKLVSDWTYDKLWKVALLHVPHIKHLHDDKVNHNTALKILKLICDKVVQLESDHKIHYEDAFIIAVENNTPEVLSMISRIFPQSIWTLNKNDYTISQLSIICRCENAYNFFVHDVTHDKFLHYKRHDENGNNLLHLAGQLAPAHKLNMVTGAALQMQRELQWFQEVETIMRPMQSEEKNKDQETPIMVFRKTHKDLRQKGEDWMKKTAESYTITAGLIITIVFAAAITVPGGNKEDTGKPNFETSSSFIIFAISDAISLFTSTTSLLLFLSILTARYAEDDFLYKLPKRLIFGLVMLFMSLTAMMIAFSATLYIMFGQDKSWILISVAVLTCLPIASFVKLQLPLLYDLVSSTYGRGIFYMRNKPTSTLLANCVGNYLIKKLRVKMKSQIGLKVNGG